MTSAAAGLLPHLTAQLHSTWVEKLEWVRDLGGLMSSSSDGYLQLSNPHPSPSPDPNPNPNPNLTSPLAISSFFSLTLTLTLTLALTIS